jgi:hypothetical protein
MGPALWVATTRSKRGRGGATRDLAAEDDSPFPGVGADDGTPLGATPEAHDELSPHDLPRDHPARKVIERGAGATVRARLAGARRRPTWLVGRRTTP